MRLSLASSALNVSSSTSTCIRHGRQMTQGELAGEDLLNQRRTAAMEPLGRTETFGRQMQCTQLARYRLLQSLRVHNDDLPPLCQKCCHVILVHKSECHMQSKNMANRVVDSHTLCFLWEEKKEERQQQSPTRSLSKYCMSSGFMKGMLPVGCSSRTFTLRSSI